MIARTLPLFNHLNEDDSSLIYMGGFDDHFTDILIEVNDAASTQDKKSTRKKVSYLIAECFQNIVRHADPDGDFEGSHITHPKMFALRHHKGTYLMSTSNIVHKTKLDKLEQALESLQNLGPEELKKIYLNSLQTGGHNEAGGAGLGLIEMARKSKKAPSYHFEDINQSFTNFFMQIEVRPKDSDAPEGQVPIESSRSLYRQLVDQKILLVRKGNFSHDQVVPLFKLIEANVTHLKAGSSFNKKSIYCLIEMLQNISKHGFEKEGKTMGVFTISELDEHHQINSGNYIRTAEVSAMQERLDELSEMNTATLKRIYKKALFNFDHEGKKGGAGIGLIEMFKVSIAPVKYSFEVVDHELSFFSLTITI